MDTPIFLTSKLAPHLLGPIAIAAYSYMALVPVIQPPIMRALTTEAERKIKIKQLRSVSKAEKIIFPIIITAVVAFNEQNRTKVATVSLNLQASQNGIGLALNF